MGITVFALNLTLKRFVATLAPDRKSFSVGENMKPSNGEPVIPEKEKKPSVKAFLAKLRKRHIIETLAAFIAGGWLLIEIVERLIVGHYRFPEETIDLTGVSVTRVSKESAK
jgi:hypothetical protein